MRKITRYLSLLALPRETHALSPMRSDLTILKRTGREIAGSGNEGFDGTNGDVASETCMLSVLGQ